MIPFGVIRGYPLALGMNISIKALPVDSFVNHTRVALRLVKSGRSKEVVVTQMKNLWGTRLD